jgi:glycerol-3-phosphate acyltransferase PlsX
LVRDLILSIDAMGGDSGPASILAGAAIARRRHPKIRFLLYGDEAVLKPLLARHRALAKSAEIRHAPAVVRMSEKPSQAVRRGRNTSMWHALEAVARGEAKVAVSAGNTGALMAISMFRIGLIEGITRPAIAVIWPTMRGQSVVLDVGANAGSDAEQLVDFAVMGEAFARAIFGIQRPTVGLLNIGEEELKGIESVKRAAQILRASRLPIEFYGNVEGDGIGKGIVDVVVTDGFTGNVALKAMEGLAKLIVEQLRTEFSRDATSKLSGLLARPVLRRVGEKLDPRRYNGACMVGLTAVVVKSHGSADRVAFAQAVATAATAMRRGLPAAIANELAKGRA